MNELNSCIPRCAYCTFQITKKERFIKEDEEVYQLEETRHTVCVYRSAERGTHFAFSAQPIKMQVKAEQ